MITIDQLKQIMPRCKNPDEFLMPLNAAMEEFDITTELRQAAFLAQLAHESGELNILTENLNYSASGLVATWPKRFGVGNVPGKKNANEYHRKPEKIANSVYANRMGNGDESSGDGWKYRGRGPIQMTGKDMYEKCSQALFGDDTLVDDPDRMLEPEVGTRAAAWFWTVEKNLNPLADAGDMTTITKRINGGTIGLNERLALYEEAKQVLV